MLPVVSPEEMRAIDAAAASSLDILIERAGWATAHAARDLLGSVYGRRIVVLAGPGNNGNDGRVGARVLRRWGAGVEEVDARTWRAAPVRWDRADLIIDAAFGTGLRRPFEAPDLAGLCPRQPLVLAVDIASGLDGETGQVNGAAMRADATITFGAYKPGVLIGEGPVCSGRVTVAGLGLDTSGARIHLLESGDLDRWPTRSIDSHKWQSAVWVIGGSPAMPGAPRLAAMAAGRAGAGYVLGSTPGLDASDTMLPVEAVGRTLGLEWGAGVLDHSDRVAALVIGPGLSTDARERREVRRIVADSPLPLVLDAGALDAIAVGRTANGRQADHASCLQHRDVQAVLTPHDGEFARLMGKAPGVDRIGAVRTAAAAYNSVVLLKGPTTIVADPDGRVLLSTAGDARLATAGTGDVLSGVIGAGLALGLEPFEAAGLGAQVHGQAALLGHRTGLVAGDLPELVAAVLSAQSTGETAANRNGSPS